MNDPVGTPVGYKDLREVGDPWWFAYLPPGLDHSWRDQAECRDYPTALFFPERGDNAGVAEAKTVCARCPVCEECDGFALATKQREGIWGGRSGRQQRQRRARKTA